MEEIQAKISTRLAYSNNEKYVGELHISCYLIHTTSNAGNIEDAYMSVIKYMNEYAAKFGTSILLDAMNDNIKDKLTPEVVRKTIASGS